MHNGQEAFPCLAILVENKMEIWSIRHSFMFHDFSKALIAYEDMIKCNDDMGRWIWIWIWTSSSEIDRYFLSICYSLLIWYTWKLESQPIVVLLGVGILSLYSYRCLHVYLIESNKYKDFYLRHGKDYVFIVVRCLSLSVCLSICLLATSRKNGWTDFYEVFRVGGTWYMEQLGTFSGYSI